ncbi:DNA polymerase V [Catalinimonas alkaloidigena]|uniref:Y-family DNA polymerase n=1 Tax=Catalinimonas alkaloidigena TaxID=1075417 RepID=UPI00240493AD|nr:Y-family DNA polymerase [Catalinimonas alkaloidigena]MDF9797388.1 DNA polymerase V [Catalinimonas alkaloidigena]
MFALVDCNHFYVSCERVFKPHLNHKAVVVLSNNDGCIIAISPEAKALGIKMGAPVFEVKHLLNKHRVTVYSSNYPLYGDMSRRVMQTLREIVPDIEVYSIDEAFLQLSGNSLQYRSWEQLGNYLRNTVYQWTGIPTCVGIAPTKTLAKIANRIAKKSGLRICILENDAQLEQALASTSVEDIWGVGRQYAAFLYQSGIKNALQFSRLDESWVKKHMSVVGLRLHHELRGISCLSLETISGTENKKMIGSSRSFVKPITKLSDLKEAVATYCSRVGEKLRVQHSCASMVTVYIRTNRFNSKAEQYANALALHLPVPTDSTPELISYAFKALEKIYRDGLNYKKAGVLVQGLVPSYRCQQHLFDEVNRTKHHKAMLVMDKINRKYGRFKLRSASMGFKSCGETNQGRLSKKYTSNWSDILEVYA